MRRDVDAKVFADAINGDGVLRVRVTTAAADNTIARVAIHDEDNALSILIVDGNIADAIALRDEPRADALAGLKALTGTGVRTVMLTDHHQRTAAAIGRQLGIEARASLLPEDKLRIVGGLQGLGL